MLQRFGAVLCSLSFTIVSASPVFARNSDTAKDTTKEDAAKTNSGTTTTTTSTANTNAKPATAADPSATPMVANTKVTALLNVLVSKGVIAPAEAAEIRSAAPEAEFQLLVEALSRKGVLTAADLNAAAAQPASETASSRAPEAYSSVYGSGENQTPTSQTGVQAPGTAVGTRASVPVSSPTVVAAVAPVRVLPVDPPKKDGLVPAFKTGKISITPFGFIKASAVHDSSSPNGDDFPFVGLFLSSTNALSTGPTTDPEFHLKARSTRLGANFEWPDASPKLTFTGKVEGDYEGNFSEVDNRDVSSIRSNAFQLRQAWVRMDYAATDATDLFFEGGQDWAIFSSTVLPNLFETTFLGAYYGTLYERSPQMRFGVVQKISDWHKFKFSPEIALMMPSSGQIEKLGSLGLQGQIGQGEREGADSGRPELEARTVFQWQLDDAPGVAAAQLFWAGFYSRRESIITSDAVLSPFGGVPLSYPAGIAATYAAAFPAGFTVSSKQYGDQVGISLPTRWATLVATGYFGGDLRFFFGGQVNSYFTDTASLSNPLTYATLDGGPLAAAGGAILATNSSGAVVVAPQRPIRSFGGFINLGLPISRWFNANPAGHNAGWQAYLHFGKDQVVSKDLANLTANDNGELPLRMGKMAAFTLYYKFNPWCTFGFEQSIYATRLNANTGAAYTIAGTPSNEWQDHRTEFGPVFTF
jgi:hypothetical protein